MNTKTQQAAKKILETLDKWSNPKAKRVLEAAAAGEIIQYFRNDKAWTDHEPGEKHLAFVLSANHYRIKPQEFPEIPATESWNDHDNFSPKRFEVNLGYRPLLKSEMATIDAEKVEVFFGADKDDWRPCMHNRYKPFPPKDYPRFTYRTKLPLPDFSKKEMTIAEIEQKLGHSVKIVKENA